MLLYEFRINGQVCGEYQTLEEALQRARAAVVLDADLDPEIIDRRTGRACMIAASKRWRERRYPHLLAW